MAPDRNTPETDPADHPGKPPATVESDRLLGPGGELRIRHEGRIYTLRRTRLGKLILTA